MAWQLRLTLPKFKVTQQTSSGVTRRSLPRGRKNEDRSSTLGISDSNDVDVEKDAVTGPELDDSTSFQRMTGLTDDHPSVSLHYVKQKAATAAWGRARSALLKAAVEGNAMPLGQCCISCSDTATCRCIQCAPWAYYCSKCFTEAHTKINIFHIGEVWENGTFKPIDKGERTIDVRLRHDCSSAASIHLCCLDETGNEHKMRFMYCRCEPLVATMVRARLWPATPQYPHLAFTFELLDWAEALLLECQVALKDLCKALCFRCPHLTSKRKDFYPELIDAFEEYRYMKVELRHLMFAFPDLDYGIRCPACPKNSGTMVLSMDALFGLPRKKSAGISFRDPIHGHVFFGQQERVDEHVATASLTHRKGSKMCSDFLAGDSLRSLRRYHALDETAVFGSACRHEFPIMFINLKHGERLAYAVWLLQELCEKIPKDVNLYVMYDIACSLVRHLQSNGEAELLERVHFAVPSFHAYCHIPSCQVLYSPRNCEGLGLSDGEVMERLWSYLRRFSRMTKEMRPAHRIDVLSHALLYYAFTSKQKLARLLVQRWVKAKGLQDVASSTYTQLISHVEVPVTEAHVLQWIEDEKVVICTSGKKPITASWRPVYFTMLNSYYATRESLLCTTSKECTLLRQKLLNMEDQLEEFEQKHQIMLRWKPGDEQYVNTQHLYFTEKQESLQKSMRAAIVKRHYLLKLKAKYADGQKIAKRLSTSIARETRAAKALLEEYNIATSAMKGSHIPVAIDQILSPDAEFWQPSSSTSLKLPWSTQKDIMNSYLLMRRSQEELHLLHEEMDRLQVHCRQQKELIINKIDSLCSSKEQYTVGLTSLLFKMLEYMKLYSSKVEAEFAKTHSSPFESQTVLSTDYDTDSSDNTSSVESDCDLL